MAHMSLSRPHQTPLASRHAPRLLEAKTIRSSVQDYKPRGGPNPSRPMLFVPRQVALAAASSSSQPRAAAAMAKEEGKKEKKSKSKSKAAAKETTAAADGRAAVVASVAAFLEAGGLTRTLAALQSEADLEVAVIITLSTVRLWCSVLMHCC